MLDEAVRRHRVKELLVLTGERPEVNAERRGAARASTASRTSPPTSSGSASRRWSAGCCRTPTSACSRRGDLARLRGVTASQGLMLESINPRSGRRTRARRPSTRRGGWRRSRAAGELKIPFTSGILVGIGETEEERVAALEALARAARRARPPAGGDPPELRPAPELLRPRAGGDRRRRRRASTGAPGVGRRPAARCARRGRAPVTIEDLKRLIAETRRLMPGVGDPGAAEPVATGGRSWSRAGATDLGGLSANGDHISPEHPFPSPAQVRKRLRAGRLRAVRAPVRVPGVHRSRSGSREPVLDVIKQPLLVVHPAARQRAARGELELADDRRAARRRARRARATR